MTARLSLIITLHRYYVGLSPGGLSFRIEACLTHQYRLIRTFPGITGKVTSLVSHYRRVQTAEKRNFFLSSLRFALLFSCPPPPSPPIPVSSLHGKTRPLAGNVVSSRFLLVFTPSSAYVNRPIPALFFLYPFPVSLFSLSFAVITIITTCSSFFSSIALDELPARERPGELR